MSQLIAFTYNEKKYENIIFQSNQTIDELKKNIHQNIEQLEKYEFIPNRLKNIDFEVAEEFIQHREIISNKEFSENLENAETIENIKEIIERTSKHLLKTEDFFIEICKIKPEILDYSFYIEKDNHKNYIFQNKEFLEFIIHRISMVPESIEKMLKLNLNKTNPNIELDKNVELWIEKTKHSIKNRKFNTIENAEKQIKSIVNKKNYHYDKDSPFYKSKFKAISTYFEIISEDVISNNKFLTIVDGFIKEAEVHEYRNKINLLSLLDKDLFKGKEKTINFLIDYPNIFLKYNQPEYIINSLKSTQTKDIVKLIDSLPTQELLDNLMNFCNVFRNSCPDEFIHKDVLKAFIQKFPKNMNKVLYGGFTNKDKDIDKVRNFIKTEEIFDYCIEKNCWDIAVESDFNHISKLTNPIKIHNLVETKPVLWETENPVVKDWIKNPEIFSSLLSQNYEQIIKLNFSSIFINELIQDKSLVETIAMKKKSLFSKIIDHFQNDEEVLKSYICNISNEDYINSNIRINPNMWINHGFILEALKFDMEHIKNVDIRTQNNNQFILKVLAEVDKGEIHDNIVYKINPQLKRILEKNKVVHGEYHSFFNTYISHKTLHANLDNPEIKIKKVKI